MARASKSKKITAKDAVPAVGIVGLSLSMAGTASAGTGGLATNVPQQGPDSEITAGLHEEEVADISLATFYIFDKENAAGALEGAEQHAGIIIRRCRCGCRCNCRCGWRRCRCGCGGCRCGCGRCRC